jgi:Domain of unknown function (DUF1893)
MSDLETAKTLLLQQQLTLVIVKNGETIFETRDHRISGFLNAIERLGEKLDGAAVADKVAGKAVALLCVYAGIVAVYAEVVSKKAKDICTQNGVTIEWKELVDNILNDKKQDVCPFEKEATTITNPKEAYEKFKALQEKLRACR